MMVCLAFSVLFSMYVVAGVPQVYQTHTATRSVPGY